MKRLNDIRQTFLDFFHQREHHIVPSAPLVPQNDPTLLFTNAGMVQFKDLFTGQKKPKYPCATSSQKCLRAGGKHNDLENVGYTARHHTFFEMLGNFSFGDYFKEKAILYAWELIRETFQIPKDRLFITVYQDDNEAFALWKKISALNEARIIRIGTDDNFWSMGSTGPCGPCSEIFYDHGDHLQGHPPGHEKGEGDRFVEIWNLVFMQYEQSEDGKRAPLPAPAIDTGMGLERIAALLQNTHDNYQTDLFQALIKACEEATGVRAEGALAASHRVIADHIRAASFLIAEGIAPSNVGRGYVLRRILRRAMRHAHLLGAREPMLHRLAPALQDEMGAAYPELIRARDPIAQAIQDEEERFQDMLQRGLKLLQKEKESVKKGGSFGGAAAFKLYDTYGFPLDLTEDILRRDRIKVDKEGFEKSMREARQKSRAAWQGSGEEREEKIWFDLQEAHGASDFLGYETLRADARLLALVIDGEQADQAAAGEEAMALLDQTPFYAESGGQVGDTGSIANDNAEFRVEDTVKRAGSLTLHRGTVKRGVLRKGDPLKARIDADRREKIRANHSATHLLNEALRRVLGAHVQQKGSLVAPNRLRFDFSHPKPLAEEEIARIENLVNAEIRANRDVITRILPFDKAMEEGALALFGEKYDDEVRVLFIGDRGEDSERGAWSVELCGGTHVRRLGDIALFRIVSESAIGSGIRRVEGLTGEAALQWSARREAMLKDAAAILRVPPERLSDRLRGLIKERERLEAALKIARRQAALAPAPAAAGESAKSAEDVEKVGETAFMSRLLSDVPASDLRSLADEAKARLGSGVVALASVHGGKASLVVGVTKDLTARHDAVRLAREGSRILGGKGGGGRADLALAGGPKGGKAQDALAAVKASLNSLN